MPELKIFHLGDCPTVPMKGGRGQQVRLINTELGTDKLDLHLNRLDPREPGGNYHHHSNADTIVEGTTYIIREDDVIYIPAGHRHSLTNKSDQPFEIWEIYAPAGAAFDFVQDD